MVSDINPNESYKDGGPSKEDTIDIDVAHEIPPVLPPIKFQLHIGWHGVVALAAALFLGLGLLGAVWILTRPLALLILGIAIAAALAAPVLWLSRRMPRILSIVLVHLLVLAALIGLVGLLVPPLITQFQQFNESLPQTLDWLDERVDVVGVQDLDAVLNNALSSLSGIGAQLLALPMALSDALFDIFVVFFLSVYGLMAAPDMRKFAQSLLPEPYREDIRHLLSKVTEAMGGYVRGVTITGAVVGVVTYFGLTLIGVPYPIVLSVLAGILEIIPVIGTTISLLIITGVALMESTSTGLITFAFMVTVQLLEGNILFPNIVGRQTDSSPLLSMFAFFAGMSVGGILGGVVGVPLAAALRVIIVEAVAPAVRRWTHAGPREASVDESTT